VNSQTSRNVEGQLRTGIRQQGQWDAAAGPEPAAGGSHLGLYLFYRVALGVALLLVYFAVGRGPLGTYLPGVFTVAVHLYLGLAIVALIVLLRGSADGCSSTSC